MWFVKAPPLLLVLFGVILNEFKITECLKLLKLLLKLLKKTEVIGGKSRGRIHQESNRRSGSSSIHKIIWGLGNNETFGFNSIQLKYIVIFIMSCILLNQILLRPSVALVNTKNKE